jgi:hypothetical protein
LVVALIVVPPIVQSVRFVYEARQEGVARGILYFPIQYSQRPREVVEKAIEKVNGRHVIFVRYSATHDGHDEWVYNSPDIDSQRVIWARDRGEENQKLEAYYPDRTFWLVDADSAAPQPQLLRRPSGQLAP